MSFWFCARTVVLWNHAWSKYVRHLVREARVLSVMACRLHAAESLGD